MRYAVIAAFVLMLAVAGIWLGAETGYRSGMQHACALQEGTVVLSIKALNELKSDDTNSVQTIQSLGFAAALFLLESCSESVNTNLPSFKALIDYRQRYRTNPSEWTPVEHE